MHAIGSKTIVIQPGASILFAADINDAVFPDDEQQATTTTSTILSGWWFPTTWLCEQTATVPYFPTMGELVVATRFLLVVVVVVVVTRILAKYCRWGRTRKHTTNINEYGSSPWQYDYDYYCYCFSQQ